MRGRGLLFVVLMAFGFAFFFPAAPQVQADPAKYPQFAQQTLPADLRPEFISVDTLVAEIKKGAKPLIIDVRTAEEFKQAHILSAVSAPLENFREYIKSIPRDRLTILY